MIASAWQRRLTLAAVLALGTDLPAQAGGLVSAGALRAELAARTSPLTLLDARDGDAYARGHLRGAIHIDWKDYRDGRGRTGKLSSDLGRLASRLGERGVSNQRPVVVYGDAHTGWGEEGRIAWMLLFLGHSNVRVLDGGFASWVAEGGGVTRERTRPVPGAFVASPRDSLRARMTDVARATGLGPDTSPAPAPVVLDVRSRDEWDGARRYWEPRTGHIPGAVHLEWRDLLDSTGRLRRGTELSSRFAALGLRPERPVIVYCTGGVRSAEAFWMLRELGFTDVRNFDGSWYEWAFDKTKPVAR